MEILKAEYDGDEIKVKHGEDITAYLRDNYEARKNSDENWKRGKDLKLVASLPMPVYLLWQSLGILDDTKELFRALERNPEYKTTEKRLI